MSIGIWFHHKLFVLPFAITTGLNALGYFSIGHLVKVWMKDISRLNDIAWYYKMLMLAPFFAFGKYALNGMGTCDYGIIPLDYVAGVSGTIICFFLSWWISNKQKHIGKLMAIIGQYTISILIIHQFMASYAWKMHIEDTNHVVMLTLTMGVSIFYVIAHCTTKARINK